MRIERPSSLTSPGASDRLKALTPLARWSAQQVTELRAKLGFEAGALPPVSCGIALYRVSYATTDLRGQPVTASGLLLVPEGSVGLAPVLSYQHGTTAGRNAGPSRNLKSSQYLTVAAVFGGSGYVVSMPDYLGFGDSAEPNPDKFKDVELVKVPGANHERIMHPYCNARTEATAAADMLIAVGEAADKLGAKLSGKLFLNGYSQGGQATMALHRHLETDPEMARRFKVTASVPIAGPHDLVRSVERLMQKPNPEFGVATLVYGFLARDHGGKVWPKVTDYLNPGFAERAWQNFSSDPPAAPANVEHPWKLGFENTDPKKVLTAKVQAELFDGDRLRPEHPYTQTLIANSPHLGWKSATPIQIICPKDDDIVPWDINGVDVLKTMKANGFTNASLLLVPGDHLSGARAAFSGAAAAMEKLR